MIDVFSYIDYRKLLKDLYEDRKKAQSFFSYRYIGMKVGFTSAGYFTNILQGKRNISSDLVFKFAELFKFNAKETEFFELLVLYDHAAQHNQKQFYYEKILAQTKSKVRTIAADQYEYFSKWYYVAVRELLRFYRFTGDYRELGRKIRPYLSPKEAKESVDLLLRLKLVEQQQDGYFKLADQNVETAKQIPLVAITNYLIAGMELGKEAIDRFPRDKRSISSTTLSISKNGFQKINEKLADFRSEVQKIVQDDPDVADRVYQFNFQIFPLTDIEDT